MHRSRRLPLARGWNVCRGGALRQHRGVPDTRAHSCWKEKCQMYCGSRSGKERGSGQLIKPVRVRGRLVEGVKLLRTLGGVASRA